MARPKRLRFNNSTLFATAFIFIEGMVRGLSAAAVTMYMATTSGVLDLDWDEAPQNLLVQVLDLKHHANVLDRQPSLSELLENSQAYLVPAQNGAIFYTAAEDMDVIHEYVQAGGLVILLDASQGEGEAQKDFIARALGYQGCWSACKTFNRGMAGNKRLFISKEHASSFLPMTSWPDSLEDLPSIQAHAACHHTDSEALTWPLYSFGDDESATVVQAFGRRGTRGAVVWLGYSWREGPRAQWGALLGELLEAFQDGAYQSFDGPAESQPLHLHVFEQLVSEVSHIAEATDDIIRRLLQGTAPTYPPPPQPQPPSLSPPPPPPPPPSSTPPPPPPPPPTPAPTPTPSSTPPPTPTPSPSSPPPSQPPIPSPTPSPSSPPAPEAPTTVKFKQLLGMGVYVEQPKSVVWFDDPDFRQYRRPRSHVNLVYWGKLNDCNVTFGVCAQCPRAWQADTTRNVTILFREPWQLDAIHITQIQNPGVLVVELLPWPAVTVPGLEGLAQENGSLAPPIRNVTVDKTRCGGTLRIPLGARSGTDLRVPKWGSQDNIPPRLKPTTLGGVNIIVKEQPAKGANPPGYTFIESVRFNGRVLYPKNAGLYGPDHP